MKLIARYEKRTLSNTSIPIVASNENGNGFTNLYFTTIPDVQQGDLLELRATVQCSGLGRNFPIFVAGRISVTTFSGAFGGNQSPAHGVDVSAPDHNPYAIIPHVGAWIADQNYTQVWPIVWGWARSAGNEGNTVDVLNQGILEVLHYRNVAETDQSAAIAALQAQVSDLQAADVVHDADIVALEDAVAALQANPPVVPTVVSVPPEGVTIQFVQGA